MDISLDGWDIGRFDELEWSPWGSGGNARAKTLASGDGFYLSVVEADAVSRPSSAVSPARIGAWGARRCCISGTT